MKARTCLPEPSQYDTYIAENDDAVAATIRSIREIESLGSQVTYASADVRSADSLRIALAGIRAIHASLNGVYFGALKLDDVPPGEYLLKVWHEGFGVKERKVKVGPNQVLETRISFGG